MTTIIVVNVVLVLLIVILGASNFFRAKKNVDERIALVGLVCLWITLFVDLSIAIRWSYYKYENWYLALLIVVIFILQGPVVWFWKQCTIEIPDDPTHCGAIQAWGKRSGKVVSAGFKFHAPFLPFNLTYIPISLVQRKSEVNMTVWCNSGKNISVECRVRFSVVWEPDPSRTDDFINKGKDSGIINRLSDIAEAQVEEFSEQKEWKDFLSSKKEVRDNLIQSMVNISNPSTLSIETGASDNHSLGIIIFNLMVEDVEPVDETLKKSMTEKAIEEAQKEALKFQEDTERELANSLVKDSAGTLNLKEAIQMVKDSRQLREGEAKKTITEDRRVITIEGLEKAGDVGTLLALMTGLQGGGKK